MLPNKKLLRPDEVAIYFNVTVKTIYAWIKHDYLEAYKIRKTLRIKRESVEKCLASSKVNKKVLL